jgi:Tfp pilus assembly protein PilF
VAGAGALVGEPTVGAPARPVDAAAVAANNRGVGLMGRFEYEPARQVFAELAGVHPDWLDAQVNLAIATLNRQLEGDERAALAIVDGVLGRDPGHLRAHYVAGLLRLYLSSPAEALPHFERVRASDPRDAYAAYYTGQCLAQLGRPAEALAAFRQALELDPYLRSAYYGAFQALQRTGQTEEARRLAGEYQRLATNPRARLAEFKYTRMGPRAEALAAGTGGPRRPVAPPSGPAFGATTPLAVAGETPPPPSPPTPASLTVVDLQGDGVPDLFIAGALPGTAAPNRVLVGQPDGTWRADPDHPLAAISAVRAVAWGDLDNDGLVDAYLARRGPNQLWRQVRPGTWEDATAASRTDAGERDSVDAALFDADHDGDLDIFVVNADGPNELLSNDRNGAFRPLAVEQGLAGPGGGSRTVVPVDLDADRDLDLIVVQRTPPHQVFVNDRLWAYRPESGVEGLVAAPVLAALAGDHDSDGLPEVYTVEGDGQLARWMRSGDGPWVRQPFGRVDLAGGDWAQLAVLDADGDGSLDLFAATAAGWSIRRSDGETMASERRGIAAARPWLPGPGAGPGVLALDRDGAVLATAPAAEGRYPYLLLALGGGRDPAQGMRSNADGIGARVTVRSGERWSTLSALRPHSGPGQGLEPLALGLGAEGRADFVAIDWSDGVFQSELDLAPGVLHRVTETQRQLSSCPVLFAWDGARHAFVTDFLGVGGLGYALGPGQYAEPRPWERVLLPGGLARPRDGRYVLKLTEPMEEVGYLDRVGLVAYDLPPGWDLVLDERMATGAPPPTGEPRFFRRQVLPIRATNGRGEDVTAAVQDADGSAAPLGPRDVRFLGRLADEEILAVDFAEPLDAGPGVPVLVADGWVEYPYSQTSFAAWQAGAAFEPPTLETLASDGRWLTVWPGFGYPAGMPRRMSLPLAGLPPGTRALRLRGNLEVYWDRLAVAFAEPLPATERRDLALAGARLAAVGFPLRSDGPQRRPDYDYSRRAPFWDTRYAAGFYTRIGPVDELVGQRDDALAILGAGEEVHVEFEAPPDPPPGWSRRLVLEAYGWTKDMDLFTRDGETVEPLPSSGAVAPPGSTTADRAALHQRYNTRYLAGH